MNVYGVVNRPEQNDDGDLMLWGGVAKTKDRARNLFVEDSSRKGIEKFLMDLRLRIGKDREYWIVDLSGKGYQKREIAIWGAGGTRVRISEVTNLLGNKLSMDNFSIRKALENS